MKRLISALGLMLGLGLLVPSFASAASITCQPYSIGYPDAYLQYCTGVTQTQASAALGILGSAPGLNTVTTLNKVQTSLKQYIQNLHSTNSALGMFYVFRNDTDFETWAADTTNPNSFASKKVGYPDLAQLRAHAVAGDTPTQASTGNPLYTLLFANIDYKGVYTVNNILATTSAHELGHWVDALFAATTGQTAVNGAAASSYFKTELGADWADFGAFPACPGVFSYHADNTGLLPGALGPYYICSDNTNDGTGNGYNTNYAKSTSNRATLSAAWADVYNSTTNELLAEEYGAGPQLGGASDLSISPLTEDAYLGYNYSSASFQCTQAFIHYLVNYNAIPKMSSPPQNWPAVCPLF